MIEKKIHYVWFGGEKPEKVLKCIASWKEKLPDYELTEWNEQNFPLEEEIKKNRFFRECYHRKLWAFVSDYVRVKVLYEEGGIYLDTDMEILKDVSPLLDCQMFLGYENESTMSFGILGVIPKHPIFKKMYEFYQEEIWKSPHHIVTSILTDFLIEEYGSALIEHGIHVYPREYFYPFNHDEEFQESCIQENTYAIHWWGKSWKKNPKVYFLKYKHLPWGIRHIRHGAKLWNVYWQGLLRK